jgi:hypothetical protein
MKRRRFAIVVDDQLVGVVEAHGNSQAADGLGRGVDLIPLKHLRTSARLRPLFYQALSLLADRPPMTQPWRSNHAPILCRYQIPAPFQSL